MNAPLCSYVGCTRPAEALGLCHAHYRQKKRGRPLSPLRGPSGARSPDGAAGVKLPGVTVSRACAEALQEVNPSPYVAARTVLERWAEDDDFSDGEHGL